MFRTAILAALALVCVSLPAEARQHHRHHHRRHNAAHYGASEIVAHPAGCPRSLFCGCGASVRIFGHSVRQLWLAANWFKFPRGVPAPGMAAVRRHHVFVLERAISGDVWLTYDANSGGHATRLHARSIVGYTIAN